MQLIRELKPDLYQAKIPKILFYIYKNIHINYDIVLKVDDFQEPKNAIETIKSWLERGGIYMAHFNQDYTKFIIFKDEHTEKFIRSKDPNHKEEEKPKKTGWYGR